MARGRDLLLRHIDAATSRLQPRQPITDDDVHEARKSIKRARAVLRLLQPALDTDEVARSRAGLRDAGRALSSARDARVMADRFAEMLDRAGIDAFAVSTIPGAAAAARRPSRRPRAPHRGHPAASRTGLRQARAWLSAAPLRREGRAPLVEGLRAIYRKARRERPTAAGASPESLHEWRKRVKDHLHALEAIAEVGRPTRARRAIGAVRRLAETLGEEHDLALLEEALRTCDASDDARVTRLLAAIRLRRRRLRHRALEAGSDLYADTPAAMARKLRRVNP